MYTPPTGPERDAFLLAPYAMSPAQSRGRKYPEREHPFRPLYQRDRERIVHCSAFRRLMLKTQVLTAATNDHHRTRLTHSLEVAQISRTIARQLGLHEDLTEAIALSHDLGHPPFGHAGEAALDACLADHGGFDHNLQALRIVDLLESPYAGIIGLNLSWEVREAMATHSKRRDHPASRDLIQGEPTLEARVVDLADSMAYDAHDLDDAIGYGLLSVTELEEVRLWRLGADRVRRESPGLDAERFRRAVIRALIEWQVTELLSATAANLNDERIELVGRCEACFGLGHLQLGVGDDQNRVGTVSQRARLSAPASPCHGRGRTEYGTRIVPGLLCRAGGDGGAFCAANSGRTAASDRRGLSRGHDRSIRSPRTRPVVPARPTGMMV